MGVHRIFPGVVTSKFAYPFQVSGDAIKWTFTNRFYPFYSVNLCWLNFNFQYFVWNVFYTSAIRKSEMYSFHKLPTMHFFEHFLLIRHNLRITPTYRIFGDSKFVTGLGVLGGAESKNRIHFCPFGQDQPLQGIRFTVFRKTLKNLTKSFKSYLPPFLTWKQIL